MTEIGAAEEAQEPAWRERAVSRSIETARSRAELRVQRYIDAAFELIDEKGTTEFTIQEVIARSQQSLRTFYHYFTGKDELLLALFEETLRETTEDLVEVVAAETGALARLRAYTVRLYEWCDPDDTTVRHGARNRRPVVEFVTQLQASHAPRLAAAFTPISRLLFELLDDAVAAGAIAIPDTYRAAALVQQQVMYTWTGNRMRQDPRMKVSAEEAWEFCLHGLGGRPA